MSKENIDLRSEDGLISIESDAKGGKLSYCKNGNRKFEIENLTQHELEEIGRAFLRAAGMR